MTGNGVVVRRMDSMWWHYEIFERKKVNTVHPGGKQCPQLPPTPSFYTNVNHPMPSGGPIP